MRLLYSKVFNVFLAAVLILVVVAVLRESYRYFGIGQEIKSLEKKNEDLKKENEELIRIEKYFQSEEFLEKEARLKLNLTKPGEKVIIVKMPENLEEKPQEQSIAKEISNIQQWWKYFFEKK